MSFDACHAEERMLYYSRGSIAWPLILIEREKEAPEMTSDGDCVEFHDFRYRRLRHLCAFGPKSLYLTYRRAWGGFGRLRNGPFRRLAQPPCGSSHMRVLDYAATCSLSPCLHTEGRTA